MEKFIDRENELGILNEKYKSGSAEFVVIYGRRRIGKSELILRFMEGKKGIYLLSIEGPKQQQLASFSSVLAAFFSDAVLEKNPLSSWDAFFAYLAERLNGQKEKLIVAIDEFPYLVSEDRSLPSLLQSYWDTKLKNLNIMLILSGSSIGMMETEVLGGRSPLYGRRTGQLLLKPLAFSSILKFVGNAESAVYAYAVFGGTPAYIIGYDRSKSIFENIRKLVLRQDSFMYKDVEFLLREELREPRYYFAILSSIAKGNTKLASIINSTGIKRNIASKYLAVLEDMLLVERRTPVTEDPLRSRNGIYVIADNFFRFWFRYVFPYKNEIERGDAEAPLSEIKVSINEYVSKTFEDICRAAVQKIRGFEHAHVGSWWYKDIEIDIVAIDKEGKKILFGEAEWRNRKMDVSDYTKLKEKTKYVQHGLSNFKCYYALFSRKGFTKGLEGLAKKEGAMLFSIDEIIKLLE